jgi:transcriptional regulator with XRE-family HTH domain
MKFDHSKLLGRIKEFGYTQKSLADAIQMSNGTLSLKINNGSHFNSEEMDKIAKLLDISPCEIGEYFFKR